MATFFSWDYSDVLTAYTFENSQPSATISDEEVYATVATSPPKRRAGRRKFRETRHPVYKGVRQRNGGKWVCELREPNKASRLWLGTFQTPEMAARAHDVAAMALRGRSACLNFADSAWCLPVPVSGSTEDIRKAAVEAAEAFRPLKSETASGISDTSSVENSMYSPPENAFYVEDEVDCGMPGLLESMAEGLMVSLPPYHLSGSHWDDVACDADVLLWSHSI
ncbi:dehydration-responsive element-binding protein 1B-like [Magnolia sinica]|uniref:dehydration-responsive element-binding protein 1B-like n=1 Tax=Magnolia sinica TaxID=86752 RepID=UPI00265870E6|nr:dehydration-responsive element-binding protein 1B-like [Magnolia sinica]